jgi:pimeloyl-ACP methyl ester carboxylesterase
LLALSLALWSVHAAAVLLDTNEEDGYTQYLGVTGLSTGRNAPYRLLVPDVWNGELLIYSRGTGSATLLTTLPDGTLVPLLDESSGLPLIGVTPLTNVPGFPSGDNAVAFALEQALLAQGYAMVASDYRPDPRFLISGLLGWVVEDGIEDTLDVTMEAKTVLRQAGKKPVKRTLLWGRSQGSLVALRLLDWRPGLYDGLMSGCTVGAGAPRAWDTAIGVPLAYDIAFAHEGGWDEANWGSVGGGDIPESIRFATDVAPTLAGQLANPLNFGLFEFIRLVNDLPLAGFYPPPYPQAGSTDFNWLFTALLFVTEVRSDLESAAKANGRVGQNLDHLYTLEPEEKAYLATLGVDAEVMLAAMNAAPKFAANPEARDYVEANADVSGKLRRPVISMHTKVDGLVIPQHEAALAASAADANRSKNLVQVFTEAVGHCAFTPDQWNRVVDEMADWLNTGVKPEVADFPVSEGFDPAFVPPPWPQP